MSLTRVIDSVKDSVRLARDAYDEILAQIAAAPDNKSLHDNAQRHETELRATEARLARLENALTVADRQATAADLEAARKTFKADKERATEAARRMVKAAAEIAHAVESLAGPLAEYRVASEDTARAARAAAKFAAKDSKDFLKKSEAIAQAMRDPLDITLSQMLLAAGCSEGNYCALTLPALTRLDAKALIIAAGRAEVRLSDLLHNMVERADG